MDAGLNVMEMKGKVLNQRHIAVTMFGKLSIKSLLKFTKFSHILDHVSG